MTLINVATAKGRLKRNMPRDGLLFQTCQKNRLSKITHGNSTAQVVVCSEDELLLIRPVFKKNECVIFVLSNESLFFALLVKCFT